MAPNKHLTNVIPLKLIKRSKSSISLKTKLEIIKRLENGEGPAVVGRHFNLNESSIRCVRRNKDKIKESFAKSNSLSAKMVFRVRNPLIERTEKMLGIWIEDLNQKKQSVHANTVRNKALVLYQRLQQEEAYSKYSEPFLASKGWFYNFLKRQNLHPMKFTGEVDSKAAKVFPAQFKAILQVQNYSPKQVFNADVTTLFWKRLPGRVNTSIEDESNNDRLSLLLCSNAEGDFKCKPMLVYHTQTPSAMRGLSRHALPVYWRYSKKSLFNSNIFEDWFMNCFCIEAERYCRDSDLEFKVVLLLDNALRYPKYLNDLHSNVQVICMPEHTSSTLQPLSQGILETFKMHYLKQTLSQLLEASYEVNSELVRSFWQNYNIVHAINNIKNAWENIGKETLNAVWEPVWRDCVQYLDYYDSTVDIKDIVNIGQSAGIYNIVDDDILNFLESHKGDMSENDLMDIVKKEEPEEEVDICGAKSITIIRLSNFFTMAEQVMREAIDMDPNLARSLEFKNAMKKALVLYQDVYREKQKMHSLCDEDPLKISESNCH